MDDTVDVVVVVACVVDRVVACVADEQFAYVVGGTLVGDYGFGSVVGRVVVKTVLIVVGDGVVALFGGDWFWYCCCCCCGCCCKCHDWLNETIVVNRLLVLFVVAGGVARVVVAESSGLGESVAVGVVIAVVGVVEDVRNCCYEVKATKHRG